MQIPPQIEFQGFTPSEWQRLAIEEQFEKIDKLYSSVTSGRIVVKWPGGHHRNGGQYHINIMLRLPGDKEVDVSKTPPNDERYADFRFALNDAFKRARRQLQDEVRLMQGQVKTHEPPPTGRVTRLLEDHGFLEGTGGFEVYFHRNSVLDGGFAKLKVGTLVYYSEEQGEKGAQASTVKLAGKHGML